MTLVEFLTARWDEAEAWAKAAGGDSWQLGIVYGTVINSTRDTVVRTPNQSFAQHIADHDPAYVLADIAAKRQLLGYHDGRHHRSPEPEDTDWLVYEAGEPVRRVYPCAHLRALALPFADHPDYDASWRPS